MGPSKQWSTGIASIRKCDRVKCFNFLLTKPTAVCKKPFFVWGPLTQEVEYLPFKQRVVGSSPTRPTSLEWGLSLVPNVCPAQDIPHSMRDDRG